MEIGFYTPISSVMEFLQVKYNPESQNYLVDCDEYLNEAIDATRYSIEINYRTKIDEVLKEYAKIVLGFVSAAMKNADYHIKHIYDESPIRILVSSRRWDNGEWVGILSWNPSMKCFFLSKGFYNKDRRTVSIQGSHKCLVDSAAELAKELRNVMHSVKDLPDRHREKLKPVPMKRGPKR